MGGFRFCLYNADGGNRNAVSQMEFLENTCPLLAKPSFMEQLNRHAQTIMRHFDEPDVWADGISGKNEYYKKIEIPSEANENSIEKKFKLTYSYDKDNRSIDFLSFEECD